MKKISFEIPDRDERGVSPVIGVILMVAITVILAAVIASFVLGFGDSVQENVQAGASISSNSDGSATVTWVSEGTANKLNVTISGEDSSEITDVGGTADISTSGPDVSVSSTGTYTVIVKAIGDDSTTVVAQKEVDIDA
ncbi:type IV pilin [Halobacterium sp. PCN9]|uniref:Type IV pilin n=2 Tax=Halobacterium bonnevillei TaxID=2692200 RepID=A0A6B0SFH8_9EURY|nr:type IV pilin [Halobacterium bonnevillei]MXR20338.1 type IV pilin [Halobacterium bonnevillei]